MRIGCLQFAPQVGDVDNNLTRADEILANADPEGLDLLVLPELAFSGYNFKSLQHISPYLESPASGISSLWSRSMALKYDCTVVTGYPERVDTADSWPADPEYYNSALVISDDGETVANYRKANLYYTDVTWALEGPDGFYRGRLPNLGPTAIGICMDLNPYKFEAPWEKFEFAHHILNSGARLVIVSMAWSTHDEPTVYNLQPQEPDTSTLMYWISRFEPVIQARLDEEIIIVFANRSGMESEALYTGTSTVVGIQSGEVRIYGILGRCDNELLVVDTDAPPFAKLVHRIGEQDGVSESCNTPSSEESDTTDASNVGRTGGSLDGTSRESPSRESRHSGSTSNHAYKKSSSFSRRDDLSINVSGRPKGPNAALESPFIHTPTAPSPTPYQIRPQLFMPSDDSRLQQFIDLNSSPNPQQTQQNQPSINEPKADEQDFLSILDSRWLQPGSRGSVSSTCSSLQYWMPSARPDGLGLTADHPVARHDDFEKGERERSTHRTPRVGVLGANSSPKIAPPSSKRSQRRTTAPNGQRSLSQEPSSNDYRPGSQSRVLRRSNSTTAITSEVKTISRQMKKVTVGSDIDRGHSHSQTNSVKLRSRISTGELNGRKVVSQQQSIHPSARDTKGPWRSLSRSDAVQSVPTVPSGNSKSRGGSVGRHSTTTSHRTVATPILQPAPLSRLMDQSMHNQSHERTPSKCRADPLDRVQSMSASVGDARPASRGRPRETKPIQTTGDQTGRKRSQNSRVNQTPQPDPIDLSQFRLIEEYPSANCPVHGSRSRSGTGSRQRNTPDSRSRTQNQVSRQPANPSYHNVANGSPPVRRRPSRSGVSQTPDTHNYSLQSSLPFGDLPGPEIIVRAATIGPGHEMTTESSIPWGKDSAAAGMEPKTPVAMVLVFEQEEKPIPPMKCVDRSILNEPIMRPRSAVW